MWRGLIYTILLCVPLIVFAVDRSVGKVDAWKIVFTNTDKDADDCMTLDEAVAAYPANHVNIKERFPISDVDLNECVSLAEFKNPKRANLFQAVFAKATSLG